MLFLWASKALHPSSSMVVTTLEYQSLLVCTPSVPELPRLSMGKRLALGLPAKLQSWDGLPGLLVVWAGRAETTHPKSICQGGGSVVLQTVSAGHEDLQGQRLALGTGLPVTLSQGGRQDLWGKRQRAQA